MRDRRPDIVITDLGLPGMDGMTIIKRMRGDRALSNVPVICLSGFGDERAARAVEAGATRVLQKPCLPDALAEAVTQVLSPRR